MDKNKYGKVKAEFSPTPQEVLAPVLHKKGKLFIGVPKEESFQEKRVALTPESVNLLVNNGHRVVIETDAGNDAGFSDRLYSEAGGEIAFDLEQVFKAHWILKVTPPRPEEISLLNMNQTLFSPLHLPTMDLEHLKELMSKNITAVAYEYIQDEAGSFPMVRALSEIAGRFSILIASNYLNKSQGGHGILLGGITGVPPAKVVILGAGVVGEFATRTALGLGAEVRIFDNNLYKMMRLQNNINQSLYTSIINPQTLLEELKTADVAVGAIHSETGRSPCVVSEEMVAQMKAGSVIVDVSIDQGGCFETSRVTNHEKPVFKKYGVIHYCVPNMASGLANTASHVLSHVLTPILLNAYDYGGFEKLLHHHHGARNGVYIYKGRLTNRYLSKRFEIKYTDLDLLITSSI